MSERFVPSELPDPKPRPKCPYCNKELGDDPSFCSNCGKYLGNKGKQYKPLSDGRKKTIRLIVGAVLLVIFFVVFFFVNRRG